MKKTILCLLVSLLLLGCTASKTETETKEEPAVENTYPIATITMQSGDEIQLELYPDVAPESVKNFISLANSGYYDGLIFHRVIKGFMIQGGDPEGTGMGGPGYCIKGEFAANGVPNNVSHVRGVISMARKARPLDSAGSQFFICHADSTFLDGQYAAFGRVISGMETVDAIAATTTDPNDKPYKDQIMSSVRVDTLGVDYGEPEKLPEY